MKLEVEDIAYKILIINSLFFFINSYIISYRINHQRKHLHLFLNLFKLFKLQLYSSREKIIDN